MTDSPHTADSTLNNGEPIDVNIKEIHISKDELSENYVDVKQAGQLLDNTSERSFYRLLNEVKEKFRFEPARVSVSQGGRRKNMFLKSDILKMGELLHKQPAVIAYRTEYLSDNNGGSDSQSDMLSDVGRDTAGRQQSAGRDIGREVAEDESKNTKLAVIEGLKSISEFRSDLRELNGNVRDLNMMMQNTITKVIEQGIDLKERYLDDRIKRTEIERLQAESMAKQSEALVSLEKMQAENVSKQNQAITQQSELIKTLLEKKNENKTVNQPVALLLTIGFLIMFVGGGMGWMWIKESQKKLEQQFEVRLAQEKKSQQEQTQEILKAAREEIQKIIPVVSPVVNTVSTNAGK